jgi:hypothetical protein
MGYNFTALIMAAFAHAIMISHIPMNLVIEIGVATILLDPDRLFIGNKPLRLVCCAKSHGIHVGYYNRVIIPASGNEIRLLERDMEIGCRSHGEGTHLWEIGVTTGIIVLRENVAIPLIDDATLIVVVEEDLTTNVVGVLSAGAADQDI